MNVIDFFFSFLHVVFRKQFLNSYPTRNTVLWTKFKNLYVIKQWCKDILVYINVMAITPGVWSGLPVSL